ARRADQRHRRHAHAPRAPGIRGTVTLWAGRVETELAPEVREFLQAEDRELLPYDCRGTLLHAHRLQAAGLLSEEELQQVEERLAEIAQNPVLVEDEDEDVHTAIERLLGPVGRKIHAGRSRNDQVVTAHRLYVQD